MLRRDAEAFALADRIERHAIMMAEHVSVHVDDITGMQAAGRMLFQIRFVIIVRHEADFLAVRLVRDRQMPIFRHPARLGLMVIAERHEEVREAVLIEMIERIRLVFLRIDAFLEQPTAFSILFDARIVARRDVVRAELHRPLKQAAEFHKAVASDARIRRASFAVFGKEIIDDCLTKEFLEIHDVMRDADDLRDAPRIVDGRQRAAAAVICCEVAALVREPHRHADDVIAAFLEERRRQRAVDAAAHADDDRLVFVQWPRLLFRVPSILSQGRHKFKRPTRISRRALWCIL